jgi:8-oxo-dGTP pyrophosphatase MutT (NUDIX family)
MHSRRTLVIVHDDARVLLGFKKRGFASGLWNGFGGKVEIGESSLQSAVRELREECDLEAGECEPRGTLRFVYAVDGTEHEVSVFVVREWQGEPRETPEMRPEWFRQTEVPYASMLPDSRYWLPPLLQGQSIEGEFRYLDEAHLLNHDVRILETAKTHV